MDEKGFMLEQVNKQHRIVPVSESCGANKAKAKVDGSREWDTLIACVCADGTSFKGANGNISESWLTESVPEDDFFMASSERGWINDQLGMDWLNQVFDPVTACKSLRRRLLIDDGHASHLNFEFLQRCEHLRIGVLVFPPHCTHRRQPLDVGIFSPLATAYTTKLTEVTVGWECRVSASKALFYSIFIDAWTRSVHSVNIKKAFAKASIYPPSSVSGLPGRCAREVKHARASPRRRSTELTTRTADSYSLL